MRGLGLRPELALRVRQLLLNLGKPLGVCIFVSFVGVWLITLIGELLALHFEGIDPLLQLCAFGWGERHRNHHRLLLRARDGSLSGRKLAQIRGGGDMPALLQEMGIINDYVVFPRELLPLGGTDFRGADERRIFLRRLIRRHQRRGAHDAECKRCDFLHGLDRSCNGGPVRMIPAIIAGYMQARVGRVSLLLFGSGACALIYQTVWLRQFRLIFGASTAASAAVLAIFMGGLGLGGLFIGRRADRTSNPLALYGFLELGVAVFTALTPILFWLVRHLYLAMGGSFVLGQFLATVIRLLLSVVVLGVPTVLMGGTLPAASRAVEHSGDPERLGVSILYAMNTLGAVFGTIFSTFYLLENFGNLKTLIAAALLNTLIGLAAIAYSNRVGEDPSPDASRLPLPAARGEGRGEGPIAPPRLIYTAAAIVGFAFFLMELVWYRMLAPLLGGTTYTFGLILAVALLGIGSGSFFYALLRRTRATVSVFAILCAIEALTMAIPFALGDRVASLALLLRPLGTFGFSGFVLGWSLVAAITIFLPAFIAGAQFPLLISLLGEGGEDVGRHVGATYLWNTVGAIAGAIVGGFGALPILTAPGAWRAVVVILGVLVLLMLVWARRPALVVASSVIVAAAIGLLFATGPTAFWRHSPIGAGRVELSKQSRNALTDFQHTRRRTTLWEAEGIESSVSIANADGYAFIVNGKSDGHARFDAGTQIMGGILPALLHPNPKRAAVVGLGTGTTAGWLAAVPSIESVETVEIEPSIVHVAELCAPVNRNVLSNPKSKILIGDGREFLLGRGTKFDIISSEPSNPYRAGIANLFTTEFYEAVKSRLNPGGIFVQFLQAYEVDAPTIRTIYGTITGVFPEVETWHTSGGDLLLVGSREPIAHRWEVMEQKLRSEPFRSAVRDAWAVNDVAGVYARYVCGTPTARRLATDARPNTDDRPLVEYAFARSLGTAGAFAVAELRAFARSHMDDLPQSIRMTPNAVQIEPERLSIGVAHDSKIDLYETLPNDLRLRGIAQIRYMEGGYADAWTIWQGQTGGPRTPLEIFTYAEPLAERGDEAAVRYIEALRGEFPIEAETFLARLRWREGRAGEGVAILADALEKYRISPWPAPVIMRRALGLAVEIARDPRFSQVGTPLFNALQQPFAIDMLAEQRKSALLFAAERMAEGRCSNEFVNVIKSYEPHVPWQRIYLERRARCYHETGDPLAAQAQRDLENFRRGEPKSLDELTAPAEEVIDRSLPKSP
jgi:spermidine synthase